MNSDQEKRRFVEEEMHDPKKRAAQKPNLAMSASLVLAGILVPILVLAM